MVTIRLARHGGKKNPFYHVTVAEKTAKRDGRFIERLGFYNPVARGRDERMRIDLARVDHWLARGAQPSDRVRRLVAQCRAQAAAAANDDAPAVPEASAAAEVPAAPEAAETA